MKASWRACRADRAASRLFVHPFPAFAPNATQRAFLESFCGIGCGSDFPQKPRHWPCYNSSTQHEL